MHQKDLENIRKVLQNFKCQNCKEIEKDKDSEQVNVCNLVIIYDD